MSGRKVGVGFNYPRVLHRKPMGWMSFYRMAKRMVRFSKAGSGRYPAGRYPIMASSAVEMMRVIQTEKA
jgi:hypothetical protein